LTYPKLTKTTLSGNLFIGAQEGEGRFNTNSVVLKDPVWGATDRYFLNLTKKNILNTTGGFRSLEEVFGKGKVSLGSVTQFFKNSDHSDMNRWLKRG